MKKSPQTGHNKEKCSGGGEEVNEEAMGAEIAFVSRDSRLVYL